MKTKDKERSIQETLYFVSFMNLRAIDAAMICKTIEITSATNFTMVKQAIPGKNNSNFINSIMHIYSLRYSHYNIVAQ